MIRILGLVIVLIVVYSSIVYSERMENTVHIECGKSDSYMETCLETSGLTIPSSAPTNFQEIATRCIIFTTGMDCVSKYTQKCLDDVQQHIINNKIQGAKSFHNALCNDKKFEKEYLLHQECVIVVQRDWHNCAKDFKQILKNEIKIVTNKLFHENLMQFCCARLAFEECVFSSAKYKCSPKAAIFMRKLATILSFERQFNNCDNYERNVCSKATSTKIEWAVLVIVMFCMKHCFN